MIMKKSNVWKKTEWAGLICIFFILMILIRMLWNSGSDGEMADIRSVNSGWYQMVDGKEKALELPAMVKADQDGKIILYNNTLNPEDKNKVLSINGLQEILKLSDKQLTAFTVDFEARLPEYLRNALHPEVAIA